MDNLRPGTLVGIDRYGNKYYENPHYFYSRNRWIEYAPQYGKLLKYIWLFSRKIIVLFIFTKNFRFKL